MAGIALNSNISALTAQRRLGESTNKLRDTFTRLSSGMRINRASDDAAGLAIAAALNTDRRVFNQGVRNLNDGLSAANIVDGSLESLNNIVIRLEELAEQSANGALSNQQRVSLDTEAQALSREYFRISKSTEFNGIGLVDGTVEELRLQAGYGAEGAISSGMGGAIGTGAFGLTASYATESRWSNDVTLGDLNGDGYLDLVTAGSTDDPEKGYTTVRLGNADGTFCQATSYATEVPVSYEVELGDLNGDGILDLVTTGGLGYSTVRIGAGDGSFGAAVSYATGRKGLALGDLNGDGALDMITDMVIRLGAGDGTFGNAISFSNNGFDVALGDLNGDGLLDIVTAGLNGALIYSGKGDGTFEAAASYATESYQSNAVSLGDLNGDGLLDLVTAGYGSDFHGYATVRLGRGNATFGAARSYATENAMSKDLELADLNGDGFLDMVTSGSLGADGAARVRLGLGNGRFGEATQYTAEAGYSIALALGDLNCDGVLDMVTAGRSDANDGYATIRLGATRQGVAPLLEFDLSTMSGARQALPVFQRKLEQLSTQRGEIGVFQSRISVALNNLQVASENFAAAASQITDADVASESAQLVKSQILQQAGAAILAQANSEPQLALKLIGTV